MYYYPQTRGLSKGIWPLRGFFTVSLIPADFHTDKTHLLPECQGVPAKVRSVITEIKVTEINTPSINGAEIHVSRNVKFVLISHNRVNDMTHVFIGQMPIVCYTDALTEN